MMRFQFNSYRLNGATVTSAIVFLTQTVCLAFWNKELISLKWLIGVFLILIGSYLVRRGKDSKEKLL